MILDPTDTIDLDPRDGGIVLDRSDIPWRGTQDLPGIPGRFKRIASRVRDAIATGLGAIANLLWARAGIAIAATATPRYAETDADLAYWGETFHLPRRPDETQEDYRARLLVPRRAVTPNAIEPAIQEIVQQYGVTTPALFQEQAVDGFFVAPLDSVWNCFVQPTDRRLWADDPTRPGVHFGVYVPPDVEYPYVLVVLPGDAGETDPSLYSMPASWAFQDADTADSFVMPTTATVDVAFLFAHGTPLADVVVSEMESRRAAGVRVDLQTDTGLLLAR